MAETDHQIVTFKLDPESKAALESLAQEHERTLSAELRLAVREYLRRVLANA